MAFIFRKCDPGSGGSRPGAGRRPDITAEERFKIGYLCAIYYDRRVVEESKVIWFEKLIGDLDDTLDIPGTADSLRETITGRYVLNFYEKYFIGRVLAGPDWLYDEGGNLTFDLENHLPLFNAIAETAFGRKRQFRSAKRLPRHLIAGARKDVIGQVKLKFAIGGDSEIGPISRRLEVTDGFVASCWLAYRK